MCLHVPVSLGGKVHVIVARFWIPYHMQPGRAEYLRIR